MRRRLLIFLVIAAVLTMEVFAIRRSVPAAQVLIALLFLALLLFLWLYIRYRRKTRDADTAFRKGYEKQPCCLPIPPKYWKKPDPFLYDQPYLHSLGFEVTYNNPDIWFEQNGQVVVDLQPNTDYEIVVQVWNSSFEAPAFHVLVTLYQRRLGAGPIDQLIGTTDIPVVQVRGFPPSITRYPWKSPDEGHCCIVVQLLCADDANPNNNEGHKNVDIVRGFPGRDLTLEMAIYNGNAIERNFRLEATSYTLPGADAAKSRAERVQQDELGPEGGRLTKLLGGRYFTDVTFRPIYTLLESDARSRNRSGGFAIPEDWQMQLPDQPTTVPALSGTKVEMRLTVPEDLPKATYPITLLARSESGVLYGGVTYFVHVR